MGSVSAAHLSLDKLSFPKVSRQLSWYLSSAAPSVMLLPSAVFQLTPCSGQCHALVGLHSANQWLSSETRASQGGIYVQSRKREGSLSFSRHYF